MQGSEFHTIAIEVVHGLSGTFIAWKQEPADILWQVKKQPKYGHAMIRLWKATCDLWMPLVRTKGSK